jgi:hypothetical protein
LQVGLIEGDVVDANDDDILRRRQIAPNRKARIDGRQFEPLEDVEPVRSDRKAACEQTDCEEENGAERQDILPSVSVG